MVIVHYNNKKWLGLADFVYYGGQWLLDTGLMGINYSGLVSEFQFSESQISYV